VAIICRRNVAAPVTRPSFAAADRSDLAPGFFPGTFDVVYIGPSQISKLRFYYGGDEAIYQTVTAARASGPQHLFTPSDTTFLLCCGKPPPPP
jgi:hypothetical protein